MRHNCIPWLLNQSLLEALPPLASSSPWGTHEALCLLAVRTLLADSPRFLTGDLHLEQGILVCHPLNQWGTLASWGLGSCSHWFSFLCSESRACILSGSLLISQMSTLHIKEKESRLKRRKSKIWG